MTMTMSFAPSGMRTPLVWSAWSAAPCTVPPDAEMPFSMCCTAAREGAFGLSTVPTVSKVAMCTFSDGKPARMRESTSFDFSIAPVIEPDLSMSTMTRLLVGAGLVEKVRQPGARRDSFRIQPGKWQTLWRSRIALIHEAAALTARGLGLLAGKAPEVRGRLEELHRQYSFFGQALPALLIRLERGGGGHRRMARRIS